MTRFAFVACLLILIVTMTQAQSAQVKFIPSSDTNALVVFTPDVVTIISNKCLSCHSPSGKDQDAKDALIWDEIQGYSKRLSLLTLDDILEALEKGEMPPKEEVKKSPSSALTAAEAATLKAWVLASLDKLE